MDEGKVFPTDHMKVAASILFRAGGVEHVTPKQRQLTKYHFFGMTADPGYQEAADALAMLNDDERKQLQDAYCALWNFYTVKED